MAGTSFVTVDQLQSSLTQIVNQLRSELGLIDVSKQDKLFGSVGQVAAFIQENKVAGTDPHELLGDDEVTKQDVEDLYQNMEDIIANSYKYAGEVNTYDDLPLKNNIVGTVYNVKDSDINYAWDGARWDPLGGGSSEITNLKLITEAQIDTIVSN